MYKNNGGLFEVHKIKEESPCVFETLCLVLAFCSNSHFTGLETEA